MAIIKYPSTRSIEQTDLETHVALCDQRRATSDDRLNRLEMRVKELYDHENTNRRLVLGSLVAIASAILSTIVAIVIKFNILK